MPRSEIKSVRLGGGHRKGHCYGVSIKCWLEGQFYKLPRIYESTVKYAPSNKFVMAWLWFTAVFYWPRKGLK